MPRDLDYARLKRSFAYFVQHYSSAELMDSESDPIEFLERVERSQMTQARRSLGMAIADFVEGTQDFCAERVAEIDHDLQKRNAYTLSFLREQLPTRCDRS